MSVILCALLLMSIGGGCTSASAEEGPVIEGDDTNCIVIKSHYYEKTWQIACNITAPRDLIIDVTDISILVFCNANLTDNSNSVRKYFPDVRLQENSSFSHVGIFRCSLSHAEIHSKIRLGNENEDGLTKNITVFGREVSLTDQQLSYMQLVNYMSLTSTSIRFIKSEDFLGLDNLYFLQIDDFKIQFESGAFGGFHRLLHLDLKVSNITFPADLLKDVLYLLSFSYRHSSISLICANWFINNRFLESIEINFNSKLKELPENFFSNLFGLLKLLLNDNGLERLPSNLLRNCLRLEEINLSKNNLKSLPEGIFTDVTNLTHIYLNNNSITDIPRYLFKNQRKIQLLDLSNNRLLSIEPAMDILLNHNTVQKLVLDGNGMNISMELMKAIHGNERLKGFSMAANRLECDCSRANMISAMISSGKDINIKDVICTDGKSFTSETLDWYCDYSTLYIIIAVVFITPILLLTTAIALYYKYETHLKVFLYSRGCCLRWITEEELDRDKKYDVFISFSHKDEAFVMNELVNRIEGPPYHYKTCVHYRDWFAGEVISKQIVESIAKSKRTIIVLSPDFLDSKWSKFEFRIAHYNTLKERRTRLIALIYKDIGDLEEIDWELNAYLQTNTYVKWGDPWFWDKLNYALPHASNNNASEDTEMHQFLDR